MANMWFRCIHVTMMFLKQENKFWENMKNIVGSYFNVFLIAIATLLVEVWEGTLFCLFS